MIKIVQTTLGNHRPWRTIHPQKTTEDCSVIVEINPDQHFQTMMGFGAAFTEAACYTLMQAPPALRRRMIHLCFSKQGLRYHLGRMTIHSCDFSLDSYSYVHEGDKDLSSFTLEREEKYVIPTIKMAQKASGQSLSLLASPWSPPAYMKSNHDMKGGGHLLNEYRAIWADYMARYVYEMNHHGLSVDYLTIQNEPEAVQTWESCEYTAQEEGQFLIDFLVPSLRRMNLSNTKLLIWDHNRDRLVERTQKTLFNDAIYDAVWGIAYHWYVSNDHENLSKVHELFPRKHLLFTEGCVEYRENVQTPTNSLNRWLHGEMYGRNMINDFNHFTEGWIDWNFLLNECGGPNHVGNYCEAPLMYHRTNRQLIINPSFYYIGHFSKYIDLGARRLGVSLSNHEQLYVASFINPNHSIVTVIQNEGITRVLRYVCAGTHVKIKIPSHSITTLIDENKQRRDFK